MGGVCERPGCSNRAAAAVAADPRRLIVWIGDLETSGDSVNRICAHHADTMAVPVGWERRDVREAPRLFAVPSEPLDPPPPRRRRRKPATAAADAIGDELLRSHPAAGHPAAPARPTAPARAEVAPPATLGELHRGNAELSAGTSALLEAGGNTPLLARAFRTARAVG